MHQDRCHTNFRKLLKKQNGAPKRAALIRRHRKL
jgi:hypothetical protein